MGSLMSNGGESERKPQREREKNSFLLIFRQIYQWSDREAGLSLLSRMMESEIALRTY